MFMLWLKFIVAASVVVFCGYKICIYAEEIAKITRMGRSFIGFILLAFVTSLPELSVAISATRIHALDLALGDLFGSNLFNLTIVAVIFLFFIRKPKVLRFENTHFLSSAFSLLLIAMAAIGIIFYSLVNPRVCYSNIFIDVETSLILFAYFLGTYLIFRSERTNSGNSAKSTKGAKNLNIWLRFIIYSAILVSSAIYLAHLGDRVAQIPIKGVVLGGTFVGSLLMAIITSLPEMAVSISAMKLGSLDMALGNIFGSNMFNMAIIPITDLALGKKIILSCASSIHLFTICFVIISTGLVLSSLVYRSRNKTSGLAWDSLLILFVYVSANLVTFYLR